MILWGVLFIIPCPAGTPFCVISSLLFLGYLFCVGRVACAAWARTPLAHRSGWSRKQRWSNAGFGPGRSEFARNFSFLFHLIEFQAETCWKKDRPETLLRGTRSCYPLEVGGFRGNPSSGDALGTCFLGRWSIGLASVGGDASASRFSASANLCRKGRPMDGRRLRGLESGG